MTQFAKVKNPPAGGHKSQEWASNQANPSIFYPAVYEIWKAPKSGETNHRIKQSWWDFTHNINELMGSTAGMIKARKMWSGWLNSAANPEYEAGVTLGRNPDPLPRVEGIITVHNYVEVLARSNGSTLIRIFDFRTAPPDYKKVNPRTNPELFDFFHSVNMAGEVGNAPEGERFYFPRLAADGIGWLPDNILEYNVDLPTQEKAMGFNRNIIIPDTSRYDGAVSGSKTAEQEMPLNIHRASDSYFLPDKNGKYHYPLSNHTDPWFADNWDSSLESGVGAVAYHFARFNRPVMQNFDNFVKATDRRIPTDRSQKMILDFEQAAAQLEAAGLAPRAVSQLCDTMILQFEKAYEAVVVYGNQSWLNFWAKYSVEIPKRDLWVANYKPTYNNLPVIGYEAFIRYPDSHKDQKDKVILWQYTENGANSATSRPGNDNDLNLSKFDRVGLLEYFNQEELSFPRPPVPPTEPPDDDTYRQGMMDMAMQNKEDIDKRIEELG